MYFRIVLPEVSCTGCSRGRSTVRGALLGGWHSPVFLEDRAAVGLSEGQFGRAYFVKEEGKVRVVFGPGGRGWIA